MRFSYFGRRGVGGLNPYCFASGLRFILLFVILKIGSEGDIDLPQLHRIHTL